MKSNKGKDDFSRLLINDSLLPDIFLVRYAQELSKNALLVYLWLNMTGKYDGFDENTIKRFKFFLLCPLDIYPGERERENFEIYSVLK